MTLKRLKIVVSVILLTSLFYCQVPILSVHADTDSNDSVSDLFKEGKDGNSDNIQPNDKGTSEKFEAPKDQTPVGTSVGDYIKTVFALLFVVGLLFGMLKFVNRKNRIYDKSRMMKNMGGLSLGQQKSIQLVRIGNSFYLIGVGEDLRLLKEITDPDEIAELESYYTNDDSGAMPTTGLLNRLVLKLSGSTSTKESKTYGESMDFSNIFNTTLDEMKDERSKQINRLREKERNRDE
jgi:flagellar protein FliO/FliZ